LQRRTQEQQSEPFMYLARRLPPLVGMYEVIKYLDPRLINPEFREPGEYIRDIQGDYDDVNHGTSYYVAYDKKTDEAIKDYIKIKGKTFAILLSCIYAKKKTRYYITFEYYTEEPYSCDCRDPECDDYTCGTMARNFTYQCEYVGYDLEKAIFCYLDYVSEYKLP
tara:strand:+ start:3579 stop:4073 length:495 start_codon:yes stop_codon:yes gene_type:complete